MASTEMKELEEEAAAASSERPHWSIRVYVTEDERTGDLSESWHHIPLPLSMWQRLCLCLAGFKIKPERPRKDASPGRRYRIRGK